MSAEQRLFPSTIANSDLPTPITEPEVLLKGDFGYFPHFDEYFLHGFHWQNPKNVSFMHETNSPRAELRVLEASAYLLNSLGMSSLDHAAFANATVGNYEIVDITQQSVDDLPDSTRERYFEGGAFFTTLSDVPIYAKSGDCTWTLVQATADNGKTVGGLIHSGRKEADELFPTKAIDHLMEIYGVQPETVRLGITPSLEPEHHVIQRNDYHKHIKKSLGWMPHSLYVPANEEYHLDVASYVASQYIEQGVPADNIRVSTVGTYKSADKGYGFSYRKQGELSKRFGVAFQLK